MGQAIQVNTGQSRSIQNAADNPRQTPPGMRRVSRTRIAAKVKAEA